MFDLVLEDRISNFFCSLFIDEFGRVAAHEDDGVLARELLLQELQVGKNVQAVDAAVRPEVDQDKLVSQVLHTDRCRIKPGMLVGELFGLHRIQLLARQGIQLLQVPCHRIDVPLRENVVARTCLITLEFNREGL